jgi:hypothetical protein
LVLTDPAGDTAQVTLDAGVVAVARLDKSEDIAVLIGGFLNDPASRTGLVPRESAINAASRKGRAEALAALLEEAAATSGRQH